jgi:hypothetical protein
LISDFSERLGRVLSDAPIVLCQRIGQTPDALAISKLAHAPHRPHSGRSILVLQQFAKGGHSVGVADSSQGDGRCRANRGSSAFAQNREDRADRATIAQATERIDDPNGNSVRVAIPGIVEGLKQSIVVSTRD